MVHRCADAPYGVHGWEWRDRVVPPRPKNNPTSGGSAPSPIRENSRPEGDTTYHRRPECQAPFSSFGASRLHHGPWSCCPDAIALKRKRS